MIEDVCQAVISRYVPGEKIDTISSSSISVSAVKDHPTHIQNISGSAIGAMHELSRFKGF
mgnify:CR=1 FL=1